MVVDRMRHVALLLAVVSCVSVASTARAQSNGGISPVVSIGTGWGALWDDETNLGRGAPVTGGVAIVLRDALRVAGDIDWTSHVRDSGYLRAEGTLLGAFTRTSYLFGTAESRIRPSVGAGIGMLRSTGTLIMRSTVFGPNGQPVAGPEERSPWALTRPAFDLHGGVRVQLSEKVALRPEARWRATFGSAASPSIEPPLIGIQTVVLVDVGL